MKTSLLVFSTWSASPFIVLASAMSTPQSSDKMMRILCLHGKSQSGAVLSNKIAGARRKLARVYELDFMDAPIPLEEEGQLAWWLRDEHGKHILVEDAFEYVSKAVGKQNFDAILGFSQGGALATALAVSGTVPGVRAVLTAGAPFVQEAFDVARKRAQETIDHGLSIPKLHYAGETDAMVPVESTRKLCEEGGSGELIVHEKGHMFPTKSASVKEMLDFLESALASPASPATNS